MYNIDIERKIMNEDVLVIIPARKGSKGVPNKNKLLVGDKPLVQWSIDFAIQENIPLDNIIVSSDDDDILNIATNSKVLGYRRPENLCLDECSTESALLDVMNNLTVDDIKWIVLLQPTSPIRFKNRLNECLDQIKKNNYDSLLTVKKMANLFWMEIENMNSYSWVSSYVPFSRKRKQEMQREDYKYFDNGNIYITKKEILQDKKCRLGNNICTYSISDIESMQIDSFLDFNCINAILSKLNLSNYSESDIWNGILQNLKL